MTSFEPTGATVRIALDGPNFDLEISGAWKLLDSRWICVKGAGAQKGKNQWPSSAILRPRGHDFVHACVGHQLPHVLVVVNDDSQIYVLDGGVCVIDFDLTS